MVYGPNMSVSDFARMLEVACKMEFSRIYEETYWIEQDWRQTCQMTTSDGDTEYYGFSKGYPIPTRVDNAGYKHIGFDDESYTLQNRTYGEIIDIHRSVMEDDRHGKIREYFANAAVGHQMNYEALWEDLITGGTAATCHDGQFFFDTDHAGAANQDNDDQNSAVTTGASLANAVDNIAAVIAIMEAYTDPDGNPLKMSPTHIITKNTGATCTAWDIVLNSPQVPGSANNDGNQYYQKFTHVKSPYFSSTATWYALDCSKPIKPFIFQNRLGLEVKTYEPDRDNDNFSVKTYERFRFGYGFWATAIIGDLA